jgi:hypothetical protein
MRDRSEGSQVVHKPIAQRSSASLAVSRRSVGFLAIYRIDGFEANLRERWKVSDAIMSLSATTDRGRREKAMVALVQLEENYGPDEGQTIRTAFAALSAIAGRGVA